MAGTGTRIWLRLCMRTNRNGGKTSSRWSHNTLAVQFGRIIVAFGDLYQIPPVKAKWVFKSELWKTHFQYASNHRQQADPKFAQMLQRFRVGKLTDLDREFLKSRVVPNQLASGTYVAYCKQIHEVNDECHDNPNYPALGLRRFGPHRAHVSPV